MSSRPFVHLHCHSHYSLLDGASKLPALVKRAKALEMPALAVTDHGNLYGAVEFLREAKAVGIKPIVGLEAYVAPRHRTERSMGGGSGKEYAFHLTLLARNGEGVRNLMRLSSASFLEGFYYKPRIDKEILERHSEGLICLSGCASAEFSDHILYGKTADAEKLCDWYVRVFGEENFFVEIQDNGIQIQRDCAAGAIDIARRKGLPLVATSDAHYLTQDDSKAHDILLCINTGKTVDDPNRMKFENDQFHVRSPEEMYAAMPGHEEALATSVRIAEMVEENYKSLNLGKRMFPSFKPPGEKTPEEYLAELCLTGLRERFGENPPAEATERLDHELGIINRMGFASYFLIVWDFVRFAREEGIPNSARGSACGALVSYVLYLSHVDPLKYDLLFERFLDPNRSEAPDIDIDLCREQRAKVIEYVRGKYGAANVAQIGTFGTMAAKAALKDVGRALNIPLSRVDQVTKLIPTRLNITLEEALKEEPALRRLTEEDPEIAKLLEYARRLEGTARNVGTHAAGVVIADRPLCDMVPLQRLPNKDKDKEVVSTQWEMGDVEKAGLLKMDFLGLRNLTSLAAAVKLVEKKIGQPLDLLSLPLDDEETYQLLQRGEARGIFQLDSAGIRDLLVKMKPDRFADLIAILALYRPGPLNGGMVDEYVDVKHGRKQAVYEHAVMKEVLEDTHGVMVYQEQVMRILNRLGGIELSQAYACIKAISKKKTETIAQGRKQFVEGAVERGLEKDRATKIFELIEFFGGYGFNKSHSTAYALVLFQTAYLKAHYPTEYMAALLSTEMDGAEREKFLVEHIEDCKKLGLEVLPPNINEGDAPFRVASEGKIHFGLGAIKGVGLKAVDEIVRARDKGERFTGLDDLFERVPLTVVSQSCVEALIKAGAFDCLGARRSQWLAVLPRAAQAGQAVQEDRKRGQRSLFDAFSGAVDESPQNGNGKPTTTSSLPDIPELPDIDRLAEEKKVLGFYMSSHPLARHASLLQALATHSVAHLATVVAKSEVTLGGMITGVQIKSVQKSRSGLTRMAKLTFEDLTGSVPAMLWPEQFAQVEEMVKNDLICFVRGALDRRREPAELVISKIIPLSKGPAELSRGVVVTLRKGVTEDEQMQRLLRQFRIRPGNLDVYLEILGLSGVRRAIYKAGAALKIRHDDRMLSDLEAAVGAGNVRLLGNRGATARVEPTVAVATPAPTEADYDYVESPSDDD
ncbi:DNA polymerase III subunit alpha [Singulisphaera acidiphila]|uniref:DNA polymerase III subunit alpha n=1 Tax=Singulisphaera acidiphila (strain ATCC BAA-1392 / DSM 18658 / VKM B-2454 / MOB10) TaxID=886293 RepID=L0DA50_SINAD|nr:DNA polymerase III subunit alpha [Singulisphaera acidiphila]AGA25740.1 DNA-directed DNA polymerase III PolC [Singulisphaera acidiphila DSM 18658]